jgi:ribosomal protein S18 acetylase RimI-like enzyme
MSDERPNDEISLQTGGSELLDRIEPLWLQLRQHHAQLSAIWRASVLDSSFGERRAQLQAKATQGLLVVIASSGGCDVGYCTSSIEKGIGQVDSIYVIDAYRRRGVGQQMMLPTLAWFKESEVKSIIVDVLDGNDAAESLYLRYGFRRRSVRLQMTND